MKVGDAEWRVLMDQIETVEGWRDVAAYEIALAVQAGDMAHARHLVPAFEEKLNELERLRNIWQERRKQPA